MKRGKIYFEGVEQESSIFDEALPEIKEEDRKRGVLRSIEHDECNFFCDPPIHALSVSMNYIPTIGKIQDYFDKYCDIKVLCIRRSEATENNDCVIMWRNVNTNVT